MAKAAAVVTIIDKSTGEIVAELLLGNTYRVIGSPKAKDKAHITLLPFTTFVNLNYTEVSQVIKELSAPKVRVLMGCISFPGYGDNCLNSHRGPSLTRGQIAQISNASHQGVDLGTASPIAEDILYQSENSEELQLLVRPLMARQGAGHNPGLQTMLRNYLMGGRGKVSRPKPGEREVK